MVVWRVFNQIATKSTTTKEVTVDQSTSRSTRQPGRERLRTSFPSKRGFHFLNILSAAEVGVELPRSLKYKMEEQGLHPVDHSDYVPVTGSFPLINPVAMPWNASRSTAKTAGFPPVADDTASYCEAHNDCRKTLVWELARRSGQSIHKMADVQ